MSLASTRVDAPGSPALAADRAAVERLQRSRSRLQGLTFTVHRVSAPGGAVVSSTSLRPGSVVELVADVRTSAYRQLGADGRVIATGAARGHESVRLTLRLTEDGWRVVTATASPGRR